MVPIHSHTEASALDGLSRPKEIVERLNQIGCDCAACTDHGVVSGHIDFYKAMTKAGKHPILGIEAYQAEEDRRIKQRDAHHVLLLAKNNDGLTNLNRFTTACHRTGFYYHPRCDWQLLREFREGLICTSACIGGLLQQSILGQLGLGDSTSDPDDILEKYLNIFGTDFYIVIHTYDSDQQRLVNYVLVDMAKKRGVGVVYSNDSHYAFPEQYELHEAVLALQTGKKLADLTRKEAEAYIASQEDLTEAQTKRILKDVRLSHPPCLYILSEEEVRDSLSYLGKRTVDESISNSVLIAEQCGVTLPERRNRIPIFAPEKGWKTNKEMFVDLALHGYVRKVVDRGCDSDVYWDRFQRELQVISDADLIDYFLIVRDYLEAARKQGFLIPPGRGSSAGSLVASCLDITDVDPIKYGLYFERFYNVGREKSLPDIDSDFESEAVDWIYAYLQKKYGADHVAALGTNTRMQGKGAIKDLSRVLDVPFKDMEAINKIIGTTTESGLTAKWSEIYEKVGDELEPWKNKYPKLFRWAEELHEYNRTSSIHASAVVVADEPLDATFPLRYAAKHSKMVSQWDMHVAEDLGYLKVDLLRIRNLRTLSELNRILKEQGKDPVDFPQIQYMEHPPEMYELIDKGLTIGIFQIEDGNTARKIGREIRVRSIEDLGIIVAMNRPGPLLSGAFEKYMLSRKTGQIEVDHPILMPILESTLGTWLYQEQVIEFMVRIGYNPSEADHIRKVMGKKLRDELRKEEPQFLEKASDHMSRATAAKIWKDLLGYSHYVFNRSHSIAYGMVCQWTLYAKYHHPKEFILAGIKTETDDITPWIEEALRMGFVIHPPDINHSLTETSIVNGDILYGLRNIKGIGKTHANWVVEHRPFKDYDHFLDETKRDENKVTLPSGIRRIAVGSDKAGVLYDVGAFDSLEQRDVSDRDKMGMEEDLLGVILSDKSAKIMQDFEATISDDCVLFSEMDEPGTYDVAGIIKSVREMKTNNGNDMLRIKLSRGVEDLELAVWHDKISKYGFLLKPRVPVLAKVIKTEKGVHLSSAELLQ